MANLPANPGEALWIGGAAGKNHFNVGIGGDGGDLDHTDYSQSAIEDGFELADYFYLDSNGDVVFKQYVENGRTSENTKYSRTECRELQPNGTSKAEWSSGSGTHYGKGRSKIDHVPSAKPWVVFFQVHDADSDFFRVQTEDGAIVCRRSPPGSDEVRTVLKSSYSIGAWIDWEWRFESGTLTIKLDGTTVLTASGMSKSGCYEKFGCYNQVNNRSDGGSAPTGEYCQVTVQRGSKVTWHSGYADPTTPVFTGSTDPGGGPGGGAGNDTQAPTVPENLAAVRGDTQAALSWDASTDNVGVDHYNVYRYSASGSAGGDGTLTTLGKSTGGAGEVISSADKMVASRFASEAAGTLTEGHFRAWLDSSGSTSSRMLVYADDSGDPGDLLATSDEITISSTSEGVRDYTFSGADQIAITADTDYWVAAAWDDPGTPALTYSRDGLSAQRLERGDITYGTFPDPFGTPTGTFTGPVDLWCDVVSGTGAGTGGGGTTTTFGKTTDGTSSSASSADKTSVSTTTATASGTLVSGTARAWLSGSGSATTKLVVYADSGGAPGARLATSDPVTITQTTEAEVAYTFSGAAQIDITNGTDYWIGLAWQDPGSVSLNISRDGTASGRQEVAAYAPDPFGTPTAFTGPIDVSVTVTSGTGGGTSGGFVLLDTAAGTTYTDTGLTNGTEYTYAVAAEDAAGNESALSTSVTVIPGAPDTTPPTVPENLTAVPGDGRVTLAWSASTDPGGEAGDPVAPVGTDTTFAEDFALGGSTPFSRWSSVQNHTVDSTSAAGYDPSTTYSQTIVSAGTDHPTALRTEVRDGDTAVGSHERAELSAFGKSWNDQRNDERWYEFDVKFGESGSFSPTWSGGSNDWLIFFQWHQPVDDGAPALALSMHSDGAVYLEREPDDTPTTDTELWTPAADTWYRVVVHVKWSPSSSIGFVQIYVDDVEVMPLTFCQTQYTSDYDNYYVKLGTYRRSTVGGTTVVFHDNVRISGPPATAGTSGTSELPSGVLRYNVRRDGVLAAQVPANSSTATALVDTGLANGTQYSYTVAAVDGSLNESAESDAVLVTPSAPTIGGAPLLPGRLTGGKLEVSIAWGADLSVDENAWTWTDITEDVRQDPGISTSLGRNDESSTSNPADIALVLDNSSGDYSLGTGSAHYPYVRRNTPVRVRIDPGDGGGGRVAFLGFANGFTPGWGSLKGNVPVVTLSASGTLRRLSQGSAPLQSAYRRVMEAASTVVAYWPLEEGRSSTFAYPVRGGTPFTYTGGSPNWAADDSFDCSDALPVLSDAYGQADVTAYSNTGKSQVRLLLSIPDGGLPDGTVLMHVSMTGTIHRWDLTYGITDGVEVLGLYRYNASDGSLHSSDNMQFEVNGTPGRLSLDWTQQGSDILWTVAFTPAAPTGANTTFFVRRTLTGRTAGIVSHFELNPHNANIGATIGHITVENAITSFFADSDALIAHAGESATSATGRLARLCEENGVPLRRYTGPVSDATAVDLMGPQLVAPLLDLLRECELSGQGQLFDGRNAGLSYTTRRRREVGTVKMTIDAAAGELAGDFRPIDDDQRDRNKVTVTRLHGVSYTHEDVDGPKGTGAIGIYDDAVTVNCADDDSTVDFAQWFVLLGTVEGYRYPSVSVDLAASPNLAAAVLDIIPGERIQVTNLDTTLAEFPDATVDLIVEGIAHEITIHTWRATFRCSPYTPWATGIEGA